MSAEAHRESLNASFPAEYRDGARCAFLQSFAGERESGGFPLGFHAWPIARRNAWFAGFNRGLSDRRAEQATAS